MMKFPALAVVLLAAAAPAADDPKAEWVKVVPEGGKCEALFPVKPKETKSDDGRLYVIEREAGKAAAALMVQYSKLQTPVDVKNADNAKFLFDAGRDGVTKSFKGAKVASEKDFKFADKYPARDVVTDVPGTGVYKTRFVLTGPYFYQITILGPKEYADGPEAKKFLDSFQLKDEKK
jgi:hypothetical protein